MRKAFSLTATLALALSLGLTQQAGASHAFRAQGQQQEAAKIQSFSPAPLLSPLQRGAAGRQRFAPRRINERNRRFQYTIKASYPQLVGAKEASAAEFNRAVRELITAQVNDFKKDFEPPDQSIPKEMRESTLDAAYEITYSSADVISILFSFSVYNAGAVHPNHYTLSLNYDTSAGRALALADLFKPRSNHLQTISGYVIKELKKMLGPEVDGDWIERGAAPDSENYRSWNITRRGLSITFDPYQVASYADGPQVVLIPYAALRNIINVDGPLGKIKG
jgi:hypothetical protein